MTDPHPPSGDAGAEPILSTLLSECPALIDVVEQFVRGLPHRVSAMQDALRASSFEQLARLAHQLKGAGGSHGYSVLADNAAVIEHAARIRAVEELTEKLAGLQALIERIYAGLGLRA